MGRRAQGDGSVFYDAARGCWVGQVDLGTDPATGKRRRPKVSAATKTECREKLDGLRDERRRTGTVAPRDITVAAVLADFLASPPPGWRSPSTVTVNASHADHLTAALGKIRLAKLTIRDVERCLQKMAADGAATSTISGRRGLLARAIRRAQRDDLVGRNVAALAECPAGTVRKSRALTLEQAGNLLAAEMTPWWRAYVITGIMTGLRPGEMLGLRWEDVDFREGILRVRWCLKERKDKASGRSVLVLEELKTEESRRTLALPRPVASVLKALRAAQAAEQMRYAGRAGNLGLVFCAPDGRPCWRQTVQRGFKRLCRRAGLPGDWHPHEMRHTFVSVLSDAGVDVEDIADAAGHINSNVTRAVYRHFIADKVTRAPMAMDGIFGKAGSA